MCIRDRILTENGVEVKYLEDLTAEVFKLSPQIKEDFLRQFIREGGSTANQYSQQLYELLTEIRDEKERCV